MSGMIPFVPTNLDNSNFLISNSRMYIVKLLVLLGVIALGVNGIAPQRQVLITYPTDTPQSELDSYKEAIAAAGGQILHEFKLIKYSRSREA